MTKRLLRAGLPVIALLVAGAIAGPATASSPVPYTDPAVAGSIGLCDSQGHQLTSGNTATQPFASLAVSSVAAPKGYAAAGRTATLFAYQPIQNVPADSWSGEQLTGTSQYTNAAHPMAAATGGDSSLADFLSDYTPKWDGLVQLRLYVGAPGLPTDSTSYAALDIKVSGSTWQAVDGSAVSCTSGKAVSTETLLLPKSALATPAGQPVAAPATSQSAGHRTIWLFVVVGAVAIVAAGTLARLRTHRPPPARGRHHSSDHDPRPELQSTSEKGR